MTQSNPISRRSVLKAGAFASLASVPLFGQVARGAASAEAQPDPWHGLKVGVATYSFRKQPLDECIKGIQRVDLHYCSIKDFHLPMNSTKEQRQEVSKKFRDAGITPLSCGNITLKNDEAKCRQAFEYVRDVGAPTMVCAPDPDVLPLLDKLVKEYDVKLAIHNHGPESPHFKSPMDVWPAIQQFDSRIGLCIDVGHTARAGSDPAQAIRACKARLYDCHFKDISDLHGKSSKVELEVGRGVLDVPAMLRALLEVGFTGHVGFEFEKNPENPLPGLAESVGYTKGVLRELK